MQMSSSPPAFPPTSPLSLALRIGRYLSLLLWIAALAVGSRCAAQSITLTPLKVSSVYSPGEKAGWNVTRADGASAPSGAYGYTIKKNNHEVLQSGSLDLSSGKGTIEVTLNEPAMLYLEVVPPANGEAKVAPIVAAQRLPRRS